MTDEGEAVMEFHDAHNDESKHRFKGDVTVWQLERPAQEEQGPNPAVQAYVRSLRDRPTDTVKEASASSHPRKISMRPR